MKNWEVEGKYFIKNLCSFAQNLDASPFLDLDPTG